MKVRMSYGCILRLGRESGVRAMAREGYRPEIDGMRALAVASVVLFHLKVPLFDGGFVGVDVFFVISGFLITGLIRTEHQRGTFSFANFYVRRIRRLFPALLVTLAVTLVAGAFVLAPSRLESLSDSVILASLSASNVLFWLQSGYFDVDASLKPLLHTWSLGVEEQFYIIWPALIVGILHFRRRTILAVLFGLAVVTLAATEYVVDVDAAAAFYLMPFRVSEFLVGTALVWLVRREISSNVIKEGVCALGLGLIAVAVVRYTPQTRFPGISALLPCLGAALLIVGGSARYLGTLLTNPASVWIGRISYSLYLVHWPLLTLYGYWRFEPLSLAERVGVLAVSVLLASVMYVAVEQPFRRGKWIAGASPLRVYGAASACVVLLLASSLVTVNFSGGASAGVRLDAETIKALKGKRMTLLRRECQERGWEQCHNPVAGKMNVLVVGDSMAVDGYNALLTALPDANVVMSTVGGCPPYDDMQHLLPTNHPHRQRCIEINQKRFDPAYIASFDAIAVVVLYDWYTPEHLERFLQKVRSVSGQMPIFIFGNYFKLNTECWELIERLGPQSCQSKEFVESEFGFEPELADLSRKYDNVFFLSLKQAFCGDGTCTYALGDVPFTWDEFHLSYEFSVEMGKRFTSTVRQALGVRS